MATFQKFGATDGKSNALGGGGRAQQLKNQGMSGGLIGYIGRKNHGSKLMGKLSAVGRKKNPKSTS